MIRLVDRLYLSYFEMPKGYEFEIVYLVKVRGIHYVDFCEAVRRKKYSSSWVSEVSSWFIYELCRAVVPPWEEMPVVGRGAKLLYLYTPGEPPRTSSEIMDMFSREMVKFLVVDIRRLR